MSGSVAAVTDLWREQLSELGFADNGEMLHGPVRWTAPASGTTAAKTTARVQIAPGPTFPFAPPRVEVLDPGVPLEATFHVNSDGSLCLWDDDWAVDDAPWRHPQMLLDRVADWLERTAVGWPGDDACDLERYPTPERDGLLVLYDGSAFVPDRAVRTAPGPTPDTILITGEQRRSGDIGTGRRGRRKDRRLAWVADIGTVDRPLRNWGDIAAALGPRAGEVDRLISVGAVTMLLLLYTRGDSAGALAIRVRRTSTGIQVTAFESADTSAATRSMRAGPAARQLADVQVAVVGCGAIGSFTADLLFRSGVRHLTLLDGERLRPGNVVRHLAGGGYVGLPKAQAVRECLAAVDIDISRVRARNKWLVDLEEAKALVLDHQVVLDATGSGRTSSLLATAADMVGPGTGHTVVSVCVQRNGDVLRVDRMPLRRGEAHLPALPLLDESGHHRERGCGSPVSPTPPGAVIAAAELAHRVVVDEAIQECALPATIADVRRPQLDLQFGRVGLVTAETPRKAAS